MTGSTVDGEDVIQDALFDDYTIEEIADFVESTPGQLKEALHRGHEKLVGSRRSWAAVPKKSPIRGGEIGVIDALAMSGRDVSYRDDKD